MLDISVSQVSKAYGDKIVLDRVSFQLSDGERVALVGANGSGKSTVLKILTKSIQEDEGYVRISRGAEVGYLPQTLEFSIDETVGQKIYNAQLELRAMERRMNELTEHMAANNPNELEEVMNEYGQLSMRFEQRGGYQLDYRTETVIQALSLAYLDGSRTISTLSGGEKTRLGLATLLIRAPDILLLDEPTNHLDFAMLDWLEKYLTSYRGALLIVSHDRRFLNRVVAKIFEVDEYAHQIRIYIGNYDSYREQKRVERRQWEERYLQQQEEIRELKKRLNDKARQVGHHHLPRDNDKLHYNACGHNVQNAVSRNIRSAGVRLERLIAEPIEKPPEPMRFQANLESERVHNPVALSIANLSVCGDNGTKILSEVQFTLGRQERMLIVGANGAGKSTLLNVIAGCRQPDEGEIFVPSHIKIGYLQQEASYGHINLSVLDYFRQDLTGERKEHVSQLLSYQLFRFEEFQSPVNNLSPGQYRKLTLAKLMASRPTLLLIDELTNHLSFDVLEEFERALDDFDGPIITVSHDRWFIHNFRGDKWGLQNGKLQRISSSKFLMEGDEARLVEQIMELSKYPS